jgi:hypothetical protein
MGYSAPVAGARSPLALVPAAIETAGGRARPAHSSLIYPHGVDPLGSILCLIGALPQYEFEVGCVALGTCFAGVGFVFLVSGKPSQNYPLPARTVRLIGGGQILLGVVVAVGSFFVNAEPQGGLEDHWGGTTGIVQTGVSLAVLAAIAASIFRQLRR